MSNKIDKIEEAVERLVGNSFLYGKEWGEAFLKIILADLRRELVSLGKSRLSTGQIGDQKDVLNFLRSELNGVRNRLMSEFLPENRVR